MRERLLWFGLVLALFGFAAQQRGFFQEAVAAEAKARKDVNKWKSKSALHHQIQESYRAVLIKALTALGIPEASAANLADNEALAQFMHFEASGEKPNGEW